MEEQTWVDEIMHQTTQLNTDQESNQWKMHSIYRVPDWRTDLNKKAYKPQVVSFGPYHHGEEHLKAMEQHKLRALLHVLKRTGKHIQVFLKALREVEQQLKDCYENLEEPWLSDKGGKFLRLMVLDGCFMLEILRTVDGDSRAGYADNDPIFGSHGELYALPFIRRDILMLENQLPLLVLEKLVAMETGEDENYESINRIVLRLWSRESVARDTSCMHVLDIFRDSFVRISNPYSLIRLSKSRRHAAKIVRSATELLEAGVRFKKSQTDSFKDIKFRNGDLSLPVIIVDDATESMLLNIMAFEGSHVGTGTDVTSYAFFMGHLIDSVQDVRILQSRGIIENALGSDEAVVNLFNGLSLEVPLDPRSELQEIQFMVNGYCTRRWHVWRANLVHTYFTSPWALISLLAAIFLLILAVLQTVYALLGYYQKK